MIFWGTFMFLTLAKGLAGDVVVAEEPGEEGAGFPLSAPLGDGGDTGAGHMTQELVDVGGGVVGVGSVRCRILVLSTAWRTPGKEVLSPERWPLEGRVGFEPTTPGLTTPWRWPPAARPGDRYVTTVTVLAANPVLK